jgi:hypothetical protein
MQHWNPVIVDRIVRVLGRSQPRRSAPLPPQTPTRSVRDVIAHLDSVGPMASSQAQEGQRKRKQQDDDREGMYDTSVLCTPWCGVLDRPDRCLCRAFSLCLVPVWSLSLLVISSRKQCELQRTTP